MARDFVTEPSPSAEPKVSAAKAASVSRAAQRKLQKLQKKLDEARETNRRLHRRVQEAESGVLRDKIVRNHWQLQNQSQHRVQWALSSMDRVSATHNTMKDIYKLAAEVLGLPHERFHSVMDSSFHDPQYPFKGGPVEPGVVYANVFLTQFGGIKSYDIRGVVEAAIRHLQGQPVCVSDERAKREDAKRLSPKGASAVGESRGAHE